jgi:hypothetical protein
MHKLFYWIASILGVLLAGSIFGCGSSESERRPVYSYPGCVNSVMQCEGLDAFQCAMNAIVTKHAPCDDKADCLSVELESNSSIQFCNKALINSANSEAFNYEAKVEMNRYAPVSRCMADIFCPRPLHAVPDCVNHLCTWVEGTVPPDPKAKSGG